MKAKAIGALLVAVLAACSDSALSTAPGRDVSLSTNSMIPEYRISVGPYSMGSESEILNCQGSFTLTSDVLNKDITRNAGNTYTTLPLYEITRTAKFKSPVTCALYNGGSAGINVLGPNGWQFLGSIDANADSWLDFDLPQGSRVQVVAVPEFGYNQNLPYADFVPTGFGSSVHEFEVNGRVTLSPSFIKCGGTYGGPCDTGGGGGGGGEGGSSCPNGEIICEL